MRRFFFCACASSLAFSAVGQVTITPLSTFGNNGWLAPGGSYAYMTTGNTERGLAFANSHLYLVSRANVGGNAINVRILNPSTGADIGALNTSGISGGTFLIDMIVAGGDGTLYVDNLTTQASSSPFKIYSWANEGAMPVNVYSGAPIQGGRVGDSLAAIGSGSSTLLAAGFNNSPSTNGNNGYAIISPSAGTATQIGFSGTPPNAGDFKLGITFSDPSHVWGTQGGVLRYSSFSGSSGTLLSSYTPASNAERLMGYTVLGGRPLLAVQSTGDSHVSIYDVTDPANPVLVASGNDTTGTPAGNANGTGEEAWGPITVNADGTVSETLYSLSSNQGIQAFTITVPEPGIAGLLLIGLVGFAARRYLRK